MRAEGGCLELWLLWAGLERGEERGAELVARARRGDPSAFEEIVREHQHRVYNLAYRMLRRHEDAEDVTQEAFLRAFEGMPRFRGEAALGTWISRIAANLCLSWLRSKARRVEVSVDAVAVVGEREEAGDAGRDELVRATRGAIARLPPKYRVAVVAHYLEGRSYEEAARVVGVPVKTFKTRLYRARKLLRRMLRDAVTCEVEAMP
jgi:RNA polymerase sigma-70 factor (ECF subfamily)